MGSCKQTYPTQTSQSSVIAWPVTQGSCSQPPGSPQSDGQFDMLSPTSHAPLPQTGQLVQSLIHVWQFSFGSHVPLPQHEPQSAGHVMHVSVPLHVSSPQPVPPVVVPAVVDAVVPVVAVVVLGPLPLVTLFVVPELVPEPPFPPSPSSPSSSMPLPFAQAVARRTKLASITLERIDGIRTSRALYVRPTGDAQPWLRLDVGSERPEAPIAIIW